jgi:hypothetical protein
MLFKVQGKKRMYLGDKPVHNDIGYAKFTPVVMVIRGRIGRGHRKRNGVNLTRNGGDIEGKRGDG